MTARDKIGCCRQSAVEVALLAGIAALNADEAAAQLAIDIEALVIDACAIMDGSTLPVKAIA